MYTAVKQSIKLCEYGISQKKIDRVRSGTFIKVL